MKKQSKSIIAAAVLIGFLIPSTMTACGFENTGTGSLGWFFDVIVQLSAGMWASLELFFLTLIFSMPLGLLVCFMRRSRIKIVGIIATIYISIMRGTPLMLQLLVVYFGPYFLFKTPLSTEYRFYAAIIGFSLNYAAYFAEIYRSGIQSVPQGQYEAAKVLGYTHSQTFMKIIFPQMIRNILPAVTNEIITLVKDTSLAFAIAFVEMFTLAKHISAADSNIMPLFVAGLFYYIFNAVVSSTMRIIENKLDYTKR